ncbi:flagellar assembly protein A [Niallia sp. Krafla_26]|uniref:flagellar assembly protein A n=1 Tax=Niallia sp. Krafla_26 TaxID=3064703 RepID=UPI003D16AB3E
MAQTVVSKGKDIKQAIKLGLDILGIKQQEAAIEIVQQESTGFIGLLSKPAIVKVTKNVQIKKQHNHDSIESLINQILPEKVANQNHLTDKNMHEVQELFTAQEVDELEGKVWVQNGRIFCKPSRLHYPTITVGKGLKLLKNHEPVVGTTIVTFEDQFDIETVEEVKKTKWNVTMDSDKLNVLLHIQPGTRITYQIKDMEPSDHLNLEAEENIEVHNELTYKDVLSKLDELRVIHGFNHSEIMEAVNSKKEANFIIVTGIKTKDGQNGRLELTVDIDKQVGPKERKDGTVDFREIEKIPTVQKGQVIAFIHPPIPGIPGTTVTNEPIPPKPTHSLIIQTGKGISLIENDSKIVATETGRPFIRQEGLLVKVSVIPKHIHPGNVNMMSGNIHFKGDLDILGNIEEGMVVEAEGNISVLQNVYSSTVISNSAISIRGNAISSSISAGRHNIFTSELVYFLTIIQEQNQMMLKSIKQLINLPAFKMSDYDQKGLMPLIKLLLEKKFNILLHTTKHFIEITKKGSHVLDKEWITLSEELRLSFLSSVMNEYHTLKQLTLLQTKITELIERFSTEDEECFVKLQYTHNSVIYSAGDVLIQEKGCYSSKIHAGRKLIIDGVFRGGEVYARSEITIKESGSPGGVVSKIMVPSNGKINIDHVREGTIIRIGNAKHTFQQEHRAIRARLNENNQIIF